MTRLQLLSKDAARPHPKRPRPSASLQTAPLPPGKLYSEQAGEGLSFLRTFPDTLMPSLLPIRFLLLAPNPHKPSLCAWFAALPQQS